MLKCQMSIEKLKIIHLSYITVVFIGCVSRVLVTTVSHFVICCTVISRDSCTNGVLRAGSDTMFWIFLQWEDRGAVCTVRKGKRQQEQSFCKVTYFLITNKRGNSVQVFCVM